MKVCVKFSTDTWGPTLNRLGPAADSGQRGAAPPFGGGVPRHRPAAPAAVCAAALSFSASSRRDPKGAFTALVFDLLRGLASSIGTMLVRLL